MSNGQRWDSTLEGCDFVAVRSCQEFEGQYLDLLREFYQKPVIPIGFLPPNVNEQLSQHSVNTNWLQASKWLDQQPIKSVVFVGFGTEYKMPYSQIHELAFGLEISQLPFFWILRKPEQMDSSKLLPDRFLERTSNRGMISLGWAPQVKILAHPAIGGCLYHSGWSSIIESLGFGHPQILMPMVDDQGLNAKLLVEKGVAIEVCRNEDGSFTRDEVSKSIRLLMVEENGGRIRSHADQVKDIFADQDLHNNYVSEFIKFINLDPNRSSHG
ncbi:hypothetical protein MLD38_023238 [Melastoma candidum]|nr:hypothetical protein MLD38_023238 [Melastoma candidum]